MLHGYQIKLKLKLKLNHYLSLFIILNLFSVTETTKRLSVLKVPIL